MQRCPECDFIYEEGQRFCDMDGKALVHDPLELPQNPLKPSKTRPKFKLLALVLPSSLLCMVAFLGATQQIAQNGSPRLMTTAMGAVEGKPAPARDSQPPWEQEMKLEENTSVDERRAPSLSPARAQNRKADPASGRPTHSASRVEYGSPDRAGEKHEPNKDSKVGTFLKKTGRLLKKPFKF